MMYADWMFCLLHVSVVVVGALNTDCASKVNPELVLAPNSPKVSRGYYCRPLSTYLNTHILDVEV